MFSSQVYLLALFVLLSNQITFASRFNTGTVVNIRVQYSLLPFGLLPIPPQSDAAPEDLASAADLSDPQNLASITATIRLEDTTQVFGGRQATYRGGETLFRSVLPVVATEYQYSPPGVICELLEPEDADTDMPELMRLTAQYANTVPNNYLPSYKWAKGIRCFQLPPALAG